MGMLIFIVVMMFSGLKDCIEASIPERFPQGAEKIKLGYFKRLHVNRIRGDLIKLNDGRVLIYNISGNKTYIFDPKDDSFKRTAITDAPTFYSLYYSLPGPNTQLGITLNNGKVLFLAPEIEDDKKITEIDYYIDQINEGTPGKDIINKYIEEKTEERKAETINYIRENRKDLYKNYLKYKEYEEDARHSHLYNPETEKMEQIGIAPILNASNTYKLLLNDGRVLIIAPGIGKSAAIFDPNTNKFKNLPSNHKILGYSGYTVLSTGDIFMYDTNDTPYIYNFMTDTLIRKGKIIDFNGYRGCPLQLKDDTFCYVYQSNNTNSRVVCYNPYTEKITSTSLFNMYRDQLSQILKSENIIITGKDYDTKWGYRTQKSDRPDKYVKVYNPKTNEARVLTKKTKTTLSDSYAQSVLLDDGRILFQNIDDTIDDYELFIPYSYKKQKKAEQKQLKKQQNKK